MYHWLSGYRILFWSIKKWTIRVYTDFRDLNLAFPKDNYPPPLIDQIIDECSSNEIFSFMDGFFGYNQIQIKKEEKIKTTFIFPWGTFSYQKIPFGLKNSGATFQRSMSYVFHDIKKSLRFISMTWHPNLGEELNIVHIYVSFSSDVFSKTLNWIHINAYFSWILVD